MSCPSSGQLRAVIAHTMESRTGVTPRAVLPVWPTLPAPSRWAGTILHRPAAQPRTNLGTRGVAGIRPVAGRPDVDPQYPYPGGTIGHYGFDMSTEQLIGRDRHDLMSYCHPRWASDYTYVGIMEYRETFQAEATRRARSERRPRSLASSCGDGSKMATRCWSPRFSSIPDRCCPHSRAPIASAP